jgi:hypothetical protein
MELTDYGPISQAQNQFEGVNTSGKLAFSIIVAFLAVAAITYVYMKSMQHMQLNKDSLS